MSSTFTEYAALGDSISVAPTLGALDAAASEEGGRPAHSSGGAAALFYRNDDERWPEERGDDLVAMYPHLRFRRLAAEGATIGEVFGEQLSQLGESDAPTLVTLTIGSADLVSACGNRPRRTLREAIIEDVLEAYTLLVDAVRQARPAAFLLLATLGDPSDGLEGMPGVRAEPGALPLGVLEPVNARIRALAHGTKWCALADVHAHFLGHGASAPPPERWYERGAPGEPNAAGAHEIRRVWRSALRAARAAAVAP